MKFSDIFRLFSIPVLALALYWFLEGGDWMDLTAAFGCTLMGMLAGFFKEEWDRRCTV